MGDVRIAMKTDQVAAEHAHQQLAAPREHSIELDRRERHMPENPHREILAARANDSRSQREMEILDP